MGYGLRFGLRWRLGVGLGLGFKKKGKEEKVVNPRNVLAKEECEIIEQDSAEGMAMFEGLPDTAENSQGASGQLPHNPTILQPLADAGVFSVPTQKGQQHFHTSFIYILCIKIP